MTQDEIQFLMNRMSEFNKAWNEGTLPDDMTGGLVPSYRQGRLDKRDPDAIMSPRSPYRAMAITVYAKEKGHDGVIVESSKRTFEVENWELHDYLDEQFKKIRQDIEAKGLDPYALDDNTPEAKKLDQLRDAMYDALKTPYKEYIIFEPNQVKSKFNPGTWDATDLDSCGVLLVHQYYRH